MQNIVIYCVDLDARRPQVLEFGGEELAFDLEFFEAEAPMDLETYDRRLFETYEAAETFLDAYTKTLKSLSNEKICLSRDLPAMLYKRRYMILTILGLKLQTYRGYLKKDWKPGDLINLHDQTYFLTVRLKKIYFDDEVEQYCYEFEMP